MSDILAQHARQWRYEVNLKKTKYMCFSRPGFCGSDPDTPNQRQCQPSASQCSQHGFKELLWADHEPIEKVPCYRYLGVVLTETLDWSRQRQAVYARTADAADGARRKGIRYMQPRQAGYVWKALVRSCAEYAVDVWSDPDDEWAELDKLQVEMARAILRIDHASNRLFAIGELGWMRLVTRRRLSRLRYLWRLLTMAPTRWPVRLLRCSLGLDADERMGPDWFDHAFVHCVPGTWTAATLRLVASLELNDELVRLQQQHVATSLLEDEATRLQQQRVLATMWERVVLATLEERDQQLWENAMLSDGRMHALALLYVGSSADVLFYPKRKRIWELEAYLQNDDAYARRQQTLLRYGGHQLRVTRGRWQKLAREKRVCELCQQRLKLAEGQHEAAAAERGDIQAEPQVEDERHLVLHCPAYALERGRLRSQLEAYRVHGDWMRLELSDEALFALVMGVRPAHATAKQVKVAMSYCRQFLTTALRRRERSLAALPKTRSARPEVVRRCSSDCVEELVSVVAEEQMQTTSGHDVAGHADDQSVTQVIVH